MVDTSTYTCTLTPVSSNSVSTLSVQISQGTFRDIAGSTNDVDVEFQWTHDPIPPTVVITALEGNSGFISSDANISLIFTFNEDVEDFTQTDIDLTGGSVSNFQGSGSLYVVFECGVREYYSLNISKSNHTLVSS